MKVRVDTSPDGSLRFVVPVYRLPDGRTWVRLGRGLFIAGSNVEPPELSPYGLAVHQTLAWVEDWTDITSDFVNRRIDTVDDISRCPVFGLVEHGKVVMVWSPDPDNPFFLKVSKPDGTDITLSLLGLISDLGAPFELLQGRMYFDYGKRQIPYWIHDEELNAIQETFSEDPVQVHGDEIEALRERVLRFFQTLGPLRIMNPYTLPQIWVTFGGQPELELLISMEFTSAWSTAKKDRVLYTVTFVVKDREDSRTLVSARSLAKAFKTLVGPQGPKGDDDEPLVLSRSDFEAWWDRSVLAPVSVFDLSMFHLLGVRSPYLLPDAEFVTWVKAMEAP